MTRYADMNETTEVMMKIDRRGRLRVTAQQKQAFLEAFESSGLSGPQFASLHGIHYPTLHVPKRIPLRPSGLRRTGRRSQTRRYKHLFDWRTHTISANLPV
jgi:hypothetical protein